MNNQNVKNYQQDVIDGCYWTKKTLEQALTLTPAGYEGTWRQRCNQNRANEASERALRGIQRAIDAGLSFRSLNAAIDHLRAQGGPARSWWMKPQNHAIKQHLLDRLVLVDRSA